STRATCCLTASGAIRRSGTSARSTCTSATFVRSSRVTRRTRGTCSRCAGLDIDSRTNERTFDVAPDLALVDQEPAHVPVLLDHGRRDLGLLLLCGAAARVEPHAAEGGRAQAGFVRILALTAERDRA